MITLVAGDTGSSLIFNCTDSRGNPVDLTGATVMFRYQISSNSIVYNPCTITNAPRGVAQYNWNADELVAGPLVGEVTITDTSGKITTSQQVNLTVRAPL